MDKLHLPPVPEKDTLYEQFLLALVHQQYQKQKQLHLQREQLELQHERMQLQRERLQQQREQMRHKANGRIVRPPEDAATPHNRTGGETADPDA